VPGGGAQARQWRPQPTPPRPTPPFHNPSCLHSQADTLWKMEDTHLVMERLKPLHYVPPKVLPTGSPGPARPSSSGDGSSGGGSDNDGGGGGGGSNSIGGGSGGGRSNSISGGSGGSKSNSSGGRTDGGGAGGAGAAAGAGASLEGPLLDCQVVLVGATLQQATISAYQKHFRAHIKALKFAQAPDPAKGAGGGAPAPQDGGSGGAVATGAAVGAAPQGAAPGEAQQQVLPPHLEHAFYSLIDKSWRLRGGKAAGGGSDADAGGSGGADAGGGDAGAGPPGTSDRVTALRRLLSVAARSKEKGRRVLVFVASSSDVANVAEKLAAEKRGTGAQKWKVRGHFCPGCLWARRAGGPGGGTEVERAHGRCTTLRIAPPQPALPRLAPLHGARLPQRSSASTAPWTARSVRTPSSPSPPAARAERSSSYLMLARAALTCHGRK
jgi:hypothetical protein